MTARSRFTQADVTRAIKGARAAGFRNVKVEIDPDGTIRIIPLDLPLTSVEDDNEWDL